MKLSKIILPLVLLLFGEASLAARKQVREKVAHKAPPKTSLVVDANNGKILHSENANISIYPASLTKLMTLYLAFENIRDSKLNLNSKLHISLKAQNVSPCKLGLMNGETISAKDAILALIVKSANDAAIVLAENIAGSEEEFAKLMTQKAKLLGMKSTSFMNASGLHHPRQKTTAKDLARLTLKIKKDFPEFYPWFAMTEFTFNGRKIHGHNRVVRDYAGAEGMKTGFTNPSGFNLVTTANREGKSLVAVVTGWHSSSSRDQKMVALLDKHFGSPGIIKKDNKIHTANLALNAKDKKAKKKYSALHTKKKTKTSSVKKHAKNVKTV